MFTDAAECTNNYTHYSLTQLNETTYIEGYWFNYHYEDKMYPMPKGLDVSVDQQFINKMKEVTRGARTEHYLGWSDCRICKVPNGSREYILKKDGITFRYPEGLLHYLEEHNVYPSSIFYEFIMNYDKGDEYEPTFREVMRDRLNNGESVLDMNIAMIVDGMSKLSIS